MEEHEYTLDMISPCSPETEEGVRLYRQAVSHAEAGQVELALSCAGAILEQAFRLNRYFRSEALAIIAFHCAERQSIDSALIIAEQIEFAGHRDSAFRSISQLLLERNDTATAAAVYARIESAERGNNTSAS